jgi:uncharacterized membrane protein
MILNNSGASCGNICSTNKQYGYEGSIMEARQVATEHGWFWVKQGFELFKKNPILWIALTFLATLGLIVVSNIPMVGDALSTLLFPVIMAGFMQGSRALQQGRELELAHLFTGFKQNTASLITLGGVFLVSQILITQVMKMLGAGALVDLIMSGQRVEDPAILAQAMDGAGLGMTVGMVLLFVLMIAMQFSSALVLFKQCSPIAAMQTSARACLNNLMPLSLYGAVMMVLSFLATASVMLGWLILLPVAIATVYTAYQDLFPEQGVLTNQDAAAGGGS